MRNDDTFDRRLGRTLILDELFDLTLYRKLRSISGPELQRVLDDLVKVEERHFTFWQDFFGQKIPTLNLGRRLKFWLIVGICRILGAPAVDLVLEAIEVYGIRQYLTAWDRYKDRSLGAAIRGILDDEFDHEDTLVSRLKNRIINPERVRNIFLGLNDGMIEILGAVSGFFASLGRTSLVLVAGLTTAVAGALSMAAGAYVATSSENEVRRTQFGKAKFLGGAAEEMPREDPALVSAMIVGISYFIGSSFPILPVIFGADNPVPSILTGGTMVLLISAALAFLSGMEIRRRALINLVLIFLATGITYLIGLLVRDLLGIEI
jgi:vacuolar iron transporter family protein